MSAVPPGRSASPPLHRSTASRSDAAASTVLRHSTAAPNTTPAVEARTAPRRQRVFHADTDADILAQAIMATAPRRRDVGQQQETATPFARPNIAMTGAAATVGKRSSRLEDEDAAASPAPKLPPRSEYACLADVPAAATAARPRAVAAPPTAGAAAVATSLSQATPLSLTQVAAPPDELPMTATQTALPPADGYRAPSPPPLFSLRSVSMGAARVEDDNVEAWERLQAYLKAQAVVVVPETGSVFPAPPGASEADRARLWASSAKAFFDFIDERPLHVAKVPAAPTLAKAAAAVVAAPPS